ncbi:Hypothetical predicted protein [Paramuricea clavata]|uniref:Uncharacterized protein n=1 Tax=Paramuricea clavata TaxID=317549 RepID=A0A6S7I000_PARCT|nr:Hypothetical predicted protein [Paramuricea clavata]
MRIFGILERAVDDLLTTSDPLVGKLKALRTETEFVTDDLGKYKKLLQEDNNSLFLLDKHLARLECKMNISIPKSEARNKHARSSIATSKNSEIISKFCRRVHTLERELPSCVDSVPEPFKPTIFHSARYILLINKSSVMAGNFRWEEVNNFLQEFNDSVDMEIYAGIQLTVALSHQSRKDECFEALNRLIPKALLSNQYGVVLHARIKIKKAYNFHDRGNDDEAMKEVDEAEMMLNLGECYEDLAEINSAKANIILSSGKNSADDRHRILFHLDKCLQLCEKATVDKSVTVTQTKLRKALFHLGYYQHGILEEAPKSSDVNIAETILSRVAKQSDLTERHKVYLMYGQSLLAYRKGETNMATKLENKLRRKCEHHKIRYEIELLDMLRTLVRGIQDVKTNSLFVSHRGDDLNNCGNWTMPCRTVRHAVKMSNDGDQIYIDYAQGRPYMECENVTQSTCSIELTKSVSFYGINGRAELQCNKGCKFFIIMSPRFNITRIKFFNLVISSSSIVTEIDKGAMTELVYQNIFVRDNNYAIYSKHSTDCSILITNSSFENNFNLGIYLRCSNLTAHITSSTFELTPVSLTNIANTPTRWQKTEILIRDTIFNGFLDYTEVNVMIRDSIFRNNSLALWVYTNYFGGRHAHSKHPTIHHENNTFVNNIYDLLKPDVAAAIHFGYGKSFVSSCRFLDNGASKNPYTSVGHKLINFAGENTFNLVALKEKQAVFVGISTSRHLTNSGVIMKNNFKILCPQGYKLNAQRLCTVRKEGIVKCVYINVQCEQCPTKTYTLERGKFVFNKSNDIQCQQCPRGGDCDSGLVTAKSNFWGYKTKMKVNFVQCPPGYTAATPMIASPIMVAMELDLDCRCGNQGSYNTIEQNDDAIRSEQGNDETQRLDSEEITFSSSTDGNETTSTRSESPVCTDSNVATSARSESAVLSVLLGPFRPHQAFMCFPSSHIPWEEKK